MSATSRRLARLAPLLLALPGLVGCGSGTGPSPTPKGSPSPSPAADFTIEVVPAEVPIEVRALIPGQRSSFLVVVTDASPATGPIVITATVTGATIEQIIQPTAATPVAEVWFVPDATATDATGSVAISASRGSVVRAESRTFQVMPMVDERAADARPYFQRWIAWLAEQHPELGITGTTTWQPEFVSTLLVVSHYAYYSDDWELTLAWHIMVAPDDWSEVHLRHRGVDAAPSLAFRQDSVSEGTEPRPVAPPEVVVR
jgi:hypothetical protein